MIINNEALTTTTPTVDLYIHDRIPGGGFAEMGAATEMRLGNDSCLSGREWEPYTAETTWTVPAGTGWRSVYVQTRDTLGRTFTVSDTIYLGASIPVGELSLAQASTTTETVTIYNLDGSALPTVQFSANWMADDTFGTFDLNWGNGERVGDQDAKGGTAFRLSPGAGESYAWVWTTEFIREVPLVAYVRLKVSDNSETGEVARFSVDGGGTTYGPLSLAGSDFDASNQYQEFMLPFTFHENPDSPFLIFNFWRSGNADVYVDLVTICREPVPVTSPLIWQVPGGNYRGQGILQRYTDGSNSFSPIGEGQLHPGTELGLMPEVLAFWALVGVSAPSPQVVSIRTGCPPSPWQGQQRCCLVTGRGSRG